MNAVPRPRIAVLLPDLRPGGVERMRLRLAAAWIERGVDVDVVLRRREGALLAELPAGARVFDLAVPRLRRMVLPLARYLRAQRPDALLAAMWPLTALAPLAARLGGFRGRVVVSEHAVLSRQRPQGAVLGASARWGYRHADAVVAVSTGVADDLAALTGLPRDTFVVIHNPAAVEPQPAPARARPGSSPLILSVGTLKRVKRFDLLIEAFARIAAGGDARLCILGEGEERARLETLVARHGLGDRVSLPGYVADTAPWYAAADLFVLASDQEGFGNVIVEALAQGTPVVSTDCPAGPREILDGGRHGRLVPTGDAEALAQAMREALRAPHDAEALRARARDFAVDAIAGRYLDLLLPGRRGAAPA